MSRTSSIKRVFLLGFVIASVLCTSCKRDEILPPLVRYEQPAELAAYEIGDTIRIVARISSEREINEISLSLLSPQGLSVQHSLTFSPSSKEYLIEADYPIYDSSLVSGTYQLLIKAEDEKLSKYKYLSIRISGLALELKGYLLISEFSLDRKMLHWISPDFSVLARDTFDGDHLGFNIINSSQQLIICGKMFGPLMGYDLHKRMPTWSIPSIPNPPFPYFSSLNLSKELSLVGFYEGYIRVYRSNGQIDASIEMDVSRIPEKVVIVDDILLVDESSRFGQEHFLNIYFYPSGVLKHSIFPGLETISLFESNGDVVWLGNDGAGLGHIRLMDDESGTYWEPLTFNKGRIICAAARDEQNFLIGTELGVYWYRRSQNSLTDFAVQYHPQDIWWEKQNDRILLTEGNKMYVLNFPAGNFVGMYEMSDNIFEARPLYNR